MTAALELEGVSKIFYTEEVETHALSSIDMEIKKGEFVSIVGRSGSGKTTLLNALIESLGGDVLVAMVTDPGLAKMGFFNFVADSFEMLHVAVVVAASMSAVLWLVGCNANG